MINKRKVGSSLPLTDPINTSIMSSMVVQDETKACAQTLISQHKWRFKEARLLWAVKWRQHRGILWQDGVIFANRETLQVIGKACLWKRLRHSVLFTERSGLSCFVVLKYLPLLPGRKITTIDDASTRTSNSNHVKENLEGCSSMAG